MPIDKEPTTPPPPIGKIGPYTVFVTPPPTPKPGSFPAQSPLQSPPQPPVPPPPAQYPKTTVPSNAPPFGFFWNALWNDTFPSSAVSLSLLRGGD
ncbi:hypothetical protein LguiB_033686 [Lonicera macranthoides]